MDQQPEDLYQAQQRQSERIMFRVAAALGAFFLFMLFYQIYDELH